MDGAKTLLLQAGLPRGYWPYAMRSYCFAQNIDIVNGDSAWNKRHGQGQFDGRSIPFGCLVDFKPQPVVDKNMPKGMPDAVPGVFFGYKLNPGGLFNNEYKVVDLRDFKDMDFSNWGNPHDVRVQTVREIVWNSDTITFPLYAKYERVNRTIEGIEGRPDEEPPPGELFSELQFESDVPPVPPGPPIPLAPKVEVQYVLKHEPPAVERLVRGVEIKIGNKTFREDASGRRYEVDISGSRLYKGTNRPPYVPDYEWKLYDKYAKAELTKTWKASVAADVAKARELLEVPAIAPVPANTSSSSSSSSGPVPAVVAATLRRPSWIVPPLCVATYAEIRKRYAIEISMAALEDENGESENENEDFVPPAMPVIVRPKGYKPRHRVKNPIHALPFAAVVARPVQRPEMLRTPDALAAMEIEFNKLRFKKHHKLAKAGCWDEDLVEEMHVAKARARRTGETVHFGKIFGICVEKGSELPVGDKNRKFKGRYVFQGNDVRD